MSVIDAIRRTCQSAQQPRPNLKYEAGPDLLDAQVRGDDIPAMKAAALDAARELYGPEANLRIECVGNIHTATFPDRGKFIASVCVRCLDFPEEDR